MGRRRCRCVAEVLEGRLLLSGTRATSGVTLLKGPHATPARVHAAPTFVLKGPNRGPGSSSPLTVGPLSLSAPFAPVQVVHAYGADAISFNGVTGDGSGQTIAIVDAYNNPNIIADASTFNTRFSLPQFNVSGGPTFTVLNQTGGTSLPVNSSPGDWDVEEALDVQWAHSIAPRANIILFEAASANFTDMMTAVNTAASYSGVSAVSMSWGANEFGGETSYDSYFHTPGGHQGVTFLASTGDGGQPGQYPAYSPRVVAVGGTTLTVNNDGSWGGESGWSGSGGGISSYEAQPAFQTNKVNGLSSGFRTSPDISMDASPSSGVYVLDTFYGNATGGTGWYTVGGTSLSAPLWAGLVAIANQGRVLNGSTTLDGPTQTLSSLYNQSPSFVHDVVTGSNGFSASSGYDLVTGLGTPVADKLVLSLAGYSTGPKLGFAQQPTDVIAGNTISPGITVKVEDADGNVLTSNNSNVTISIYSGPQGSTLVGTAMVAAVNGIATFNNLSLTKVGNYTLVASDSGFNAAQSALFHVNPAAAAKLAFAHQPGSAAINSPISPAVTVNVLDSFGNVVTGNSSTVTIAIATGPTGATLGGTKSVAAVNGVATFSTLTLNLSGTYTLSATDGSLTGATSNSFLVTGPPAKLVFAVQPSSIMVGGNINPFVTVYVEDSSGNVVPSDSSSVTLSLVSGPTGGTLGGNVTVAAVNGVATFKSLYLNVGGTYTLRATDGTLTQAMSSSFVVTGSYTFSNLYTFNNTNGLWPKGNPAVDGDGNMYVTSNAGPSGHGEILKKPAGSNSLSVLATFDGTTTGHNPLGLTVDANGNLYGTTTGGGANGRGTVFEVLKGTSTIVALASFASTMSLVAPGPDVTVDAAGNVFGTTWGGGAQGLGLVYEVVKGSGVVTTLASFTSATGSHPDTNLVFDTAGNLYGTTYQGGAANDGTVFELVKGSGTITTVASFNFSTTSFSPSGRLLIDSSGNLFGTANDTVFEVVAGSNTISNVVRMPLNYQDTGGLMMDGYGNLFGYTSEFVTSTGMGGTIFEIAKGTSTVTYFGGFDGVNGVFPSGLTMDAQGNLYGVNQQGGNPDYDPSNTSAWGYGTVFEFVAPHLVFTQQPTNTASGGTISPAVKVAVEDPFGNVLATDNSKITLTLNGSGTLGGTTSVAAVNGVATFSNLSVSGAGTDALVAHETLNSNINSTSSNFAVGATSSGAIAGQVFHDYNANGTLDAGEAPLNGATVYLDLNNNSFFDSGEPSATTAGSGNYSFTALADGTYNVRETPPAGYVATSTSQVIVSGGASFTGVNLATVATAYTGASGDDNYLLRLSPAGNQYQIFVGGVLTYTVYTAAVNTLSFSLGGGDDTLTLDYSNGAPMPAGGISYTGGNYTPGDTLVITGASASDAFGLNASQLVYAGRSLTYVGMAKLTLNAGSFNVTGDLGSTNLMVNASATATFEQSQHLNSLALAGGHAAVTSGGSRVLVTESLQISGGGVLDLADNDMIIRGGNVGSWNGSAYDGITGLIASGAVSSSAATPQYTTLGVATAGDALGISGTKGGTFDSEGVSSGDVLVKFTYVGDANLDGVINIDDYTQIDSSVSVAGALKGCFNGDFNRDGQINIDDYTLIDSTIVVQGAPL